MTPDLIGLEGGINPYAYTSNNPVNDIDPEGLKVFCNWQDIVIDREEGKIYYLCRLYAWRDTDSTRYEADAGPYQKVWCEDRSVEYSAELDIAYEIVSRADRKDRVDIAISGIGVIGAAAFVSTGPVTIGVFTTVSLTADGAMALRKNDISQLSPDIAAPIGKAIAGKTGEAVGPIISIINFYSTFLSNSKGK